MAALRLRGYDPAQSDRYRARGAKSATSRARNPGATRTIHYIPGADETVGAERKQVGQGIIDHVVWPRLPPSIDCKKPVWNLRNSNQGSRDLSAHERPTDVESKRN